MVLPRRQRRSGGSGRKYLPLRSSSSASSQAPAGMSADQISRWRTIIAARKENKKRQDARDAFREEHILPMFFDRTDRAYGENRVEAMLQDADLPTREADTSFIQDVGRSIGEREADGVSMGEIAMHIATDNALKDVPVVGEMMRRGEESYLDIVTRSLGLLPSEIESHTTYDDSGDAGMMLPSIFPAMRGEEATKLRDELKDKTREEAQRYLYEKYPEETLSMLDLVSPTWLDIATLGGAKTVSKTAKIAKPFIKGIPGVEKISDAQSAVKTSLRNAVHEKIEPLRIEKTIQESRIPNPASIDNEIKGMVNKQLTNRVARRLLESRLGKRFLRFQDPTKIVREYIDPKNPRLGNGTDLDDRFLAQSLYGFDGAAHRGAAMGGLHGTQLNHLWSTTGIRVSDDTTMELILRKGGEKVKVTINDFLSEPILYKRPADPNSPIKDFLDVDSLWEHQKLYHDIVDGATDIFQTRTGEMIDKIEYGRLGELSWWTKASPSQISRETGMTIEEAKTLLAKHKGNPEELSQYSSSYIPRGPAVRDADRSIFELYPRKNPGAQARDELFAERVWQGQSIDAVEDGLKYNRSTGDVGGGWLSGIYRSIALHELSNRMKPLAKMVGEGMVRGIRKDVIGRQNRIQGFDQARHSITRMIRGASFDDAIETQESTTRNLLNRAGLSLDRAKEMASGRITDLSESDLMRWKKLPPEMKRLLLDKKEVPKKLTHTVRRENEELRNLQEMLDPDQYDMLIHGQSITDPATRRAFLANASLSIDSVLRDKHVDQLSLLKDAVRVLGRDIRVPRDVQHAANVGQKTFQSKQLRNMSDYMFTEKTANHIDNFIGPDQASQWRSVFDKFNDWSRMLMLTGDNAAPFNQGLYLLGHAPAVWAKVMGKTTAALADPRYWEKQVSQNFELWKEMIDNGMTFEGSEFFSAGQRTGGLVEIVNRIDRVLPDKVAFSNVTRRIGSELKDRPEAAFKMLRDEGRRELYLSLKPVFEAEGRALSELGPLVDNMIGVSKSIGIGAAQKSVENGLLLARGYYRAHLSILSASMQGGIRGDVARQSLQKLMMSQVAIHAYLARQTNQKMNFDPSDPDFLMIYIGNAENQVRVGIPGFQRSVIRLIADLIQQGAKSANPDRYASFPGETGMFGNPAFRWLRGKMSAGSRAATTLLDQEDYGGNDLTDLPNVVTTIARDSFMPLVLKDMFGESPGLPLYALPLTFLGMATRQGNYYSQLNNLRDKIAMEETGRPYTHRMGDRLGLLRLDQVARDQLEENHPELKEAHTRYLDSIEENEGRGFAERMMGFNLQMGVASDEMVASQKRLVQEMQTAYQTNDPALFRMYSTQELREKISGISRDFAAAREMIAKSYPDVMEYFANFDDKLPLDTTPPLDYVINDWYANVSFHPDIQATEVFDFDLYEKLATEWVQKWDKISDGQGEEIRWEVDKALKFNSDSPDVVNELRAAQLALRDYFSFGEDLARDRGVIDEWNQTRSNFTMEKSEIIKQIERIESEARRQRRREDRFTDLAVVRFWGNEKFENAENQKEFGSIEGMKAVTSVSGFSLAPYMKP
jgi:hypothetical protein